MRSCRQGLAAVALCSAFLSPATGAEVDPRLVAAFEAICIGSFPGFVPSTATLAAFEARGDDPNAPARRTRTGTNRSWTIDARIEGRYNVLIQTHFGKVDGKPASGCRLSSSGLFDPSWLDRILAALPGAAPLANVASTNLPVEVRRWAVVLAGREAVFSVSATKAEWPDRPYFEVALEQYPRSLVNHWRRSGQ